MAATDPMAGKCGAVARSGRPCGRPAGWGTPTPGIGRCKLHGGLSPNALAAAGAREAQREALLLGYPVEVHPIDAILGSLRIAWGEVHYYSQRIAELDSGEITGPVRTSLDRPRKLQKGAESSTERVVERREEAPQLHIWMKARHQAMDRATRYAEIALRAGIAERQIRLAEQAGGQLATVIGGILRELGVFDDARAPEVVRRHLTLIEGTGTTIGQEAA